MSRWCLHGRHREPSGLEGLDLWCRRGRRVPLHLGLKESRLRDLIEHLNPDSRRKRQRHDRDAHRDADYATSANYSATMLIRRVEREGLCVFKCMPCEFLLHCRRSR